MASANTVLRAAQDMLTLSANPTCRLSHLQELRLGLQMQAGAPEIGFPLGVLACRLAAVANSPCCQSAAGLAACRSALHQRLSHRGGACTVALLCRALPAILELVYDAVCDASAASVTFTC